MSNSNGDQLAAKAGDQAAFNFGSTDSLKKTTSQPDNNAFCSSINNVFGQNSTSADIQKPIQTTSNIFGQSKQIAGLFGQEPPPPAQPQSQQSTPNILSQPSTQQTLATTNILGLNSTSSAQSQQLNPFVIQNEDCMSTSPDNSPQSKERANPGPFAFLNSSNQTPTNNMPNGQDDASSLSSRVSQSEIPLTASSSLGPNAHQENNQSRSMNDSVPPGRPHTPFFGLPQAQPTQEAKVPQSSPTRTSKRMAKPSFGKSPSDEDEPATSSLFNSIKLPATFIKPQDTIPSVPSAIFTNTPQSDDAASVRMNGNSSSSTALSKPQSEPISQFLAAGDYSWCTPPLAPADFTEDQRHQLVIGFQLKCLEVGLQRYIVTTPSFYDESDVITSFYVQMKEEILNGKGASLENLPGSKRKANDDIHDDKLHAKRTRLDTSSSKLAPPQQNLDNEDLVTTIPSEDSLLAKSALVQQAVNAKRKAEEDFIRNEAEGSAKNAKRARGEDSVSYPSLSPPSSSQTSNIFKNILNNKESESLPSTTERGTQSANPFAQFPPVGWGTAKASTSPNKTEHQPLMENPTSLSQSLPTFSGGNSAPLFQLNTGLSSVFTSSQPSPSATTTSTIFSSTSSPSSNTVPIAVNPSSLAPPKFGPPVNFLSQFSKAAEDTAKKEKASRKAEDYDSDEEDEAAWEQKYAEEQKAKKQKIDEAVKGKTAKFIPGQGFILSGDKVTKEELNSVEPAEPASQPLVSLKPTGFDTSVLAKPPQNLANGHNIFAHLSDAESGAEGSKTGDADDEDTGSEEDDGRADIKQAANHASTSVMSPHLQSQVDNDPFGFPSKQVIKPSLETNVQVQPTGGLFDRISKDADGNALREIPLAVEKITENTFKPTSSKSTNLFGQPSHTSRSSIFGKLPSSASGFGQVPPFGDRSNAQPPSTPNTSTSDEPSITPSTNTLGLTNSPTGDNTWKVNSPIKFGGAVSPPGMKITSPSPSKPSLGGLFGASQTNAPTLAPTNPTQGLFGTTAAKAPIVGFGFDFGGPPKLATSSLAPPSNLASNATSRATSPGVTTGGESQNESNADGVEDGAEKHAQLDLAAVGPGEEDEEVVFTVKAKAISFDIANKSWASKGVGMLRVLKHRETAKSRLLMRQDPSGKIVLNAALLGTINYEYVLTKKVKMAVATDAGKLSTWMIQTGKDEDASELARILEAEKNN